MKKIDIGDGVEKIHEPKGIVVESTSDYRDEKAKVRIVRVKWRVPGGRQRTCEVRVCDGVDLKRGDLGKLVQERLRIDIAELRRARRMHKAA